MKREFWEWLTKPRFSWLVLVIVVAAVGIESSFKSPVTQHRILVANLILIAVLTTRDILRYRRKTTTKGTS